VRFLAKFLFPLLFGLSAHAANSRDLMQMGGDDTQLDRKSHVVTLTGNAYLYREKEVLKADVIVINTEFNTAHAEGRIQYQYGDYYIRADSMDFDMKAKTGTIINGYISNGKFALRGARIDQVEPDHFKVKDYEYSTCYDCPNAWAMTGDNVDMTIEGYVYINDFTFKIKDAPFFWFPYMVLPLKTKRQTGFLFPKFGKTSDYGYYVVEPFYWAINPSADMTFGIGDYSERGARFEWEGRYALSPRSQGTANVYFIRDSEISPLYFRWASKAAITQELPAKIELKLNLNEVSDGNYPIRYANDIAGRQQPVLTSDLFFSRDDPDLSTTLSFRRMRNLLSYTGATANAGFDPLTVQEFPRLTVTTNDHLFFDQKVAFGLETRFNRFTRAAGPFDTFYENTNHTPVEIIREANRFTLIPNVYTTLKPWPWLSVVPSVQYKSYYYNFEGVYNPLARGYLLAQGEASIQLEKIYSTSNPDVSFRHTIRPVLTYSNIPEWGIIQSSDHPFIQQVQSKGSTGKYFDDSDIVPRDTIQNIDNYFVPLGNSLTYGITTQVFRRETASDGSVKVTRRFEAGFNQTLDIYQASRVIQKPNRDDRVILSPFTSHATFDVGSFSLNINYTYYSYLENYDQTVTLLLPNHSPHRFDISSGWTIENAVKDGLLKFDRSFYLGYSFAKLTSKLSALSLSGNFSINDYLMPKGYIAYNLVQDASPHLIEVRGSMLFQSPSKCWQAELGLFHSVDQNSGITFSLALNLAGDSYQSK
jgi:LPS-assembly protein